MTAPLLQATGLTGGYGGMDILQGVDLTVEAHEVAVIIGPNGAGKSTAMKALIGLIPLKSGKVVYAGEEITGQAPERLVARGIAYVPQERNVFRTMTVEENLAMGAYLRRDHARVGEDLARLFVRFPRLEERLDQSAGTLSGGEQQMLAIARALMSRPRLMLFDEPSLGLAPNFVERIFEIIEEIRRDGVTVLMVEQNALAALEMCDRAYLIETGQVVQHGEGRAMLDNPHVRRAYLGQASAGSQNGQ